MYTDYYASTVKPQLQRMLVDTPSFVRRAVRRFIPAAETAALLEVTEDLLLRWYATGRGLQPVPRPEGRLYRAEHVERLAAMPRLQRMLAINLRRY